jgi:hypothetical protein
MQNESVSGLAPEGKASSLSPNKARGRVPSPTLDDGDGKMMPASNGNIERAAPSSSSSRKGTRGAGKFRVAENSKKHRSSAAQEIDDICGSLVELQNRRKFINKLMTRQTNALGGLIRTALGFNPSTMDEKERAKITGRASRIVTAALNGKAPHQDDEKIFNVYVEDFQSVVAALAPLEARRNKIIKEMERLAKNLPVYPFVKDVKGFGDLGLAVVIGEAGNLSNYPAKGGSAIKARDALRKRLGLAPYEGKAMSSWKGAELTKEQWIAAGYNPRRLAEIFSCVTEKVLMHQIEGTKKNGTEFGLPKGRYGEIYIRRREQTKISHPDWSKKHAQMDAMRVMACKLMDDLMREWRAES